MSMPAGTTTAAESGGGAILLSELLAGGGMAQLRPVIALYQFLRRERYSGISICQRDGSIWRESQVREPLCPWLETHVMVRDDDHDDDERRRLHRINYSY